MSAPSGALNTAGAIVLQGAEPAVKRKGPMRKKISRWEILYTNPNE